MKTTGQGSGLVAAAIAVAAVLLLAAGLFVAEPWAAGSWRPGVEPRAGLADYSWEELATIADEVGACGDEAAAYRAAARYGLCAADGSLAGMQGKELVLGDGTNVGVRLAGIWHDTRGDGGKAGLTFAFDACARTHAMNHAFEREDAGLADSVGGWAASDMRAWLDGELFYSLPQELRDRIVSVQKLTANRPTSAAETDEAGHLRGALSDWVSETSDRLWLFSVSELCGSVPERSELGVDASMTGVYAAEGLRYRIFEEEGVSAFEACGGAVRRLEGEASTWWLRSKTLEFGEGFWLVGTDGAPLDGIGEDARVARDPGYAPEKLWGADHARGVVAGFCL